MNFFLVTIMAVVGATYGVYGSENAEEVEIHLREAGDEIPCKKDSDCAEICEDYTSCGDDGICYCSDFNNDYDGVTPVAFSDATLCQKRTKPSNSCFKRCNGRMGSVSTTSDAYTCTSDGKIRCWCDYRIVQSKFEPCTEDAMCSKIDKMMNVCAKSSQCLTGIGFPKDCFCTDKSGFSNSSSKNCQRDTFCFNTCNGAQYKNGLACSSMEMGKKTCFCTMEPRKKS